ncbi:heterokaryon incompatibility protein-domain-containing protein [Daedaleopsis nitida]|nr:heterokaryon incompatibility protein-domain-containing protein [Daedaleopsis nitida]
MGNLNDPFDFFTGCSEFNITRICIDLSNIRSTSESTSCTNSYHNYCCTAAQPPPRTGWALPSPISPQSLYPSETPSFIATLNVSMWLLKTDRPELRYFSQPPEKYAILSHVWGQNEQSFQDVQALACQHSSSSNPRVLASEKIRDCCLYAEADGYEWLWIDTCCIDKTSSAELSEAINSMYQWYAKASVCYVYLHDVSACSDPIEPHSSFRTSRWFTRGWTLQELIAPRRVLFLSCEWVLLGDKGLFSSLLQEVTGIDAQVLTFRTSLPSVPVATRMRWASQRMTTRVEDEAYSLMGIFGVNIPTIYGEGSRAFRRLQEEIMKNVPDHTLFVWGHGLPGQAMADQMYLPTGSPDLLATSPADFRDCGMNVVTKSVPEYWTSLQSLLGRSDSLEGRQDGFIQTRDQSDFEIPEFAVTSHGVRVRLPVISIPPRRESSNFN